jgi:dinuclear metal center YbgI/SA1388 family protein
MRLPRRGDYYPHKYAMSATSIDVAKYADELLQSATTPDYSNALNGLQLENRSEVRSIAAAVDFSTRSISQAADAGANLLVVHHGMYWAGVEKWTGPAYRRLRALMEADIAVYSSHLPLDRHPSFGNNVLLAERLGLVPSGSFGRFEGIDIGLKGDDNLPTTALVARADKFARLHGGNARVSSISDSRVTKSWAICTGAGASAETLREARVVGIDTLIVGEGAHWTAIHAEENDLAIIYAGHYATETLGVAALAKHLAKKFNVAWKFVPAPTGL